MFIPGVVGIDDDGMSIVVGVSGVSVGDMGIDIVGGGVGAVTGWGGGCGAASGGGAQAARTPRIPRHNSNLGA
jgi:hypothetical protein